MSTPLKNTSLSRITVLITIMVFSVVAISVAFSGSAAATVDSADRSIDKTEVPNGSLVTATVDVSFSETTDGQINDKINPALDASNVEITDSEGAFVAEYQESSGTISATYFDVDSVTLTYEVIIPSDASVGTTYDFSDGEVTDDGDETTTGITGDETIEVIEGESDYTPPDDDDSGDGGIDTAERVIDSTEALPGDTVPVTASVSFDGTTSDARINDEIAPAVPADNIEIIDDDGATISSYQESSGVITGSWGSVDSVTLVYEVTIPDDATTGTIYDFSNGEAEDGDVGEVSSFAGNQTIEIVENPLLAYADDDGIIGPSGLGDAAADFRDGEISAGTLGDIASAFRSSSPVA